MTTFDDYLKVVVLNKHNMVEIRDRSGQVIIRCVKNNPLQAIKFLKNTLDALAEDRKVT